MGFVFFPSKKEAKEVVWGRCNVERTVLATEVEVMFGVGLDNILLLKYTRGVWPRPRNAGLAKFFLGPLST